MVKRETIWTKDKAHAGGHGTTQPLGPNKKERREREITVGPRKRFKRKGPASKTAVRILHLKITSSTAAPYYNSLDLISYFLSI